MWLSVPPPPSIAAQWIIFVYGKLIYTLYGSKTEEAFVKTWGIGLAIETATGFQDIAKEGLKGFLSLLLLDMFLTGPARWFEARAKSNDLYHHQPPGAPHSRHRPSLVFRTTRPTDQSSNSRCMSVTLTSLSGPSSAPTERLTSVVRVWCLGRAGAH